MCIWMLNNFKDKQLKLLLFFFLFVLVLLFNKSTFSAEKVSTIRDHCFLAKKVLENPNADKLSSGELSQINNNMDRAFSCINYLNGVLDFSLNLCGQRKAFRNFLIEQGFSEETIRASLLPFKFNASLPPSLTALQIVNIFLDKVKTVSNETLNSFGAAIVFKDALAENFPCNYQ